MSMVLVGAVESTATALRALREAGATVDLVVTLPLEKSGRHSDFVDLGPLAPEMGAPLLRVARINDAEALDAIRAVEPDYVLVIGWSQICGPEFIAIPRVGTLGYHPSPLPELRGRAVIPWTLLTRRERTGSTLFWIDEGMDSGDIAYQETFDVGGDWTARQLYDAHMDALERMVGQLAGTVLAGKEPPRVPQDHDRATYCAKRTAADGLVDWTAPAEAVWTHIRAVGDPYPGAFTFAGDRRVIIHESELVGEAPYIGLTGQIQAVDERGVLVRCGNGRHIRVLRHDLDPPGSRPLRNHERFTDEAP